MNKFEFQELYATLMQRDDCKINYNE